MKMKKVWEIAKSFGECFTMGAGVVSLVFAIVAAFTGIGIVIPLGLAIGIGLVAAGFGAYYAYRKMQAKETRDREELAERNSLHVAEARIESFAQEMDSELKDIKRDIAEHHNRSFRGFNKPRRYSGVLFSKSNLHHPNPVNDPIYNTMEHHHKSANIVNFQMK